MRAYAAASSQTRFLRSVRVVTLCSARLLLKNTLFESADNQTLSLSLDEQFSTLLTNSIQVTIQAKLQAIGIRGQFLTAIKSLYEDVRCAVRVNQEFTPWFQVSSRMQQYLSSLP
jgi:hypothetical protein